MKKKTVKRRIFLSNAKMIVAALALILLMNLIIVKVYWEFLEQEMQTYAEETRLDGEELEEILQDLTIRRDEFALVFLTDGALCAAVLVVVSWLFTGNLARHIMRPLDVLYEGAERIQRNQLTQKLEYNGELEFEEVCDTFNHMQSFILEEQEKNRKYEKARTDMIAGISHDLKTPLTAVQGALKGLIDGVADTPEQREKFLEAAYRRTKDMDVLLNQLFYLSKLETGNMPMEFQMVDISAFVRNYAESKQRLSVQEAVELTVETNGIAAWVQIDPDQLQRVFDNLIENSRKYGEVNPVQIRVSLNREKRGVCIRVSDNGVGVSEEKLPYLFDEFYRGDESRNQKEGNGLGLYIVKCLIEAMGGSVWAENANGFSVCMVLPIEKRGAQQYGREENHFDSGR